MIAAAVTGGNKNSALKIPEKSSSLCERKLSHPFGWLPRKNLFVDPTPRANSVFPLSPGTDEPRRNHKSTRKLLLRLRFPKHSSRPFFRLKQIRQIDRVGVSN